MVCYAVPLVGAVVCHIWRKSAHKLDPKYLWLNLMLLGGAIFGVVDHLWNGELFLIGNNIGMDLALGLAITLTILATWSLLVKFPALSVQETKAI